MCDDLLTQTGRDAGSEAERRVASTESTSQLVKHGAVQSRLDWILPAKNSRGNSWTCGRLRSWAKPETTPEQHTPIPSMVRFLRRAPEIVSDSASMICDAAISSKQVLS